MDFSLLVNEVVDALKKGNRGLMFKIDFEKAYDCVNWSFLDLIMRKMAFRDRWRLWIK